MKLFYILLHDIFNTYFFIYNKFYSLFFFHCILVFKPPPPVGAGGGYMFLGRPSVRASVRPSIRDSRGSFMFPLHLQYLLTDFRQTFVTGASWDTEGYVFGSKGQSSRSHHRGGGAQHSMLPSSATFSSYY